MSFSLGIEEEIKSFCNACGNQYEISRGHICATRMRAPKGSLFGNAADPFSPFTCPRCQGIYVPAYTTSHSCKSVEEQIVERASKATQVQDFINQQRAEDEAKRRLKVEEFKNAIKPTIPSLEKSIHKAECIHEARLNDRTNSYSEQSQKEHFEHIAKLQSEIAELRQAEGQQND